MKLFGKRKPKGPKGDGKEKPPDLQRVQVRQDYEERPNVQFSLGDALPTDEDLKPNRANQRKSVAIGAIGCIVIIALLVGGAFAVAAWLGVF